MDDILKEIMQEVPDTLKGIGVEIVRMDGMEPYLECKKWLNYIPDFQKKRMDYLNNKKVSELSLDEIEEIRNYKYEEMMSNLFKIYKTKKISKENYIKVFDYMESDEIEKVMLRKLTKEELIFCKDKINTLIKKDNNELRKIIKEQQKDYKNLSMIDSYILNVISQIDFKRDMIKLDETIKLKTKQNEIMLKRSFEEAKKNICF